MAVVALEELKLAPGLRLLGLDLGEKTIGLALSDTGLSIATPMQTLKRGKFAADAAQLDIIISAQGVGGLVVGLPLNMNGSDGPSARYRVPPPWAGGGWVRGEARRGAIHRHPRPMVAFIDNSLSLSPILAKVKCAGGAQP